MNFKQFLTEQTNTKIKVKKTLIADIPKEYSVEPKINKFIPCMNVVVDYLKHGYFLIYNVSSFERAVISPDDLAKVTTDFSTNSTFKIGRSKYSVVKPYYDSTSRKVSLIEITGEQIAQPGTPNNKNEWLDYADTKLIIGITNDLTRDIAESFVDENGNIGCYTNKDRSSIVAFAAKGTLENGKLYLFANTQGGAPRVFPAKPYWNEIPMNSLFSSSFKKNKFNKQRIFFVK